MLLIIWILESSIWILTVYYWSFSWFIYLKYDTVMSVNLMFYQLIYLYCHIVSCSIKIFLSFNLTGMRCKCLFLHFCKPFTIKVCKCFKQSSKQIFLYYFLILGTLINDITQLGSRGYLFFMIGIKE